MVAPRQIFMANSDQIEFGSLPKRDIRDDFLSLRPGQSLLDVYAHADSNVKTMSREKYNRRFRNSSKIGSIILESRFVASQFGDDQLFF